MGLYDDDDGGSKLDGMPSIDALTAVVLGLDGYIIYSGMSQFKKESLTSISQDPQVIAVQLSAIVLALYLYEFYQDEED